MLFLSFISNSNPKCATVVNMQYILIIYGIRADISWKYVHLKMSLISRNDFYEIRNIKSGSELRNDVTPFDFIFSSL